MGDREGLEVALMQKIGVCLSLRGMTLLEKVGFTDCLWSSELFM